MTRIHFATNRLLVDETKPEFTDGFHPNFDELRFGHVDFDGGDLFSRDVTKLGAAGRIEVAPEKITAGEVGKQKLGSRRVFEELRRAMLADGDAFLFIHGFNFTFRESAARAAQLKQWLADGGQDMVTMMFAWPSGGGGESVRAYNDDRQRARASGVALGRALLKAVDFIRNTKRSERCNGRIHLMAHSMGNWALQGAIQSMRAFVGDNIPPLFDEVVLVAADDDADTLGDTRKLAPLLRGCRRVTVYYNHQDLALKASDVVIGNPDRLGRSGPANRSSLSEKVASVNVSRVIIREAPAATAWTVDDTGHQYYRNNARVRQDLLAVLAGQLDATVPGRERYEGTWLLG